MTIIIFSDSHLTKRFDPKKFNYLRTLISKADLMVINGDFWDRYHLSFDKFLNSRWRELFPLLKAKNTVYLYGNHDRKEWIDERANLFSAKQKDTIRLNVENKSLLIQHGHSIAPTIDQKSPIKLIANKYTVSAGQGYISLGVKLFGPKFYLSKAYPLAMRARNRLIKWGLKTLGSNEFLVCGHTHIPEFNPENRYINTGFIHHGYAHYLRINDGKLKLVEECY